MDQHNPYAAPTINPVVASAVPKLEKNALATRWQRFAGSFVDSIALLVVFFGLMMAMLFVVVLIYPDYLEEPETPLMSIVETIVAFVLLVISFLMLNGYLLAKRGQTVGKLVVQTRIVSDQDELVPLAKLFFARYFLVWCIGFLPMVGGFFTLADSLAIFRENHKCLHDEFARTKVVMIKTPIHLRPLPDKPDFSKLG